MSIRLMRCKQIRWHSTKPKMTVIDTVDDLLANNEIKHRQHPGIMKPRQVEQPSWITPTIRMILHDETVSPKVLGEQARKLAAHLNGRHPPPASEDIKEKIEEIKSRVGAEDIEIKDLFNEPKARRLFKSLVHKWIPIHYDKHLSLAYLIGRSMPEYSVLFKIFTEIVSNDKNFMPRSLFDFGSGVGTVMWAASQFWINSLREYYCVDVSREINELSEYLIKKAKPQINPSLIFYRQFFPASPIPTYDIVVSAYSLFELPSEKSRIEVISKLWNKTEHYLVIVEQGTRVGYEIVKEARDFILNYQNDKREAHVFSPCPHDLQCPRYATDDTPCNFELTYLTLPIGNTSKYKHERYSYVVLKRGKRPENDCQWPRIVRPTLKRSAHIICRMCTASGKLEEQIFTKFKNGKNTYRCARSSKWGDRLPFRMDEINIPDEETKEPE